MKILIVQPWFTARGHPAPSVLNTARALGIRADVGYLISDPGDGEFSAIARELEKHGQTTRYRSYGTSLRTGSLLSLPAILRTARANADLQHVFFLDADFISLALAWPLAAAVRPSIRSVSVVYLGGPERIAANTPARKLVSGFLHSPQRRLFLRTDELRQAWQQAFPKVPPHHIDTSPSLEISDAGSPISPNRGGEQLRLGVIGQVRPGKSLEWLVPMFQHNDQIGILQVAGAFTNPAHRERLAFLASYPKFDNRFLTEADMLLAASNQDYLLALYDDWDPRMEAATLYVAARVGRPVIVYDEGWPGRMVREFGCGVAVARSPRPDPSFFSTLPKPGDPAYGALLDGVGRFRRAHDAANTRERFLSKLFEHEASRS